MESELRYEDFVQYFKSEQSPPQFDDPDETLKSIKTIEDYIAVANAAGTTVCVETLEIIAGGRDLFTLIEYLFIISRFRHSIVSTLHLMCSTPTTTPEAHGERCSRISLSMRENCRGTDNYLALHSTRTYIARVFYSNNKLGRKTSCRVKK